MASLIFVPFFTSSAEELPWQTTEPLHYYIAGVTGDDANPGTIDLPLRTVVEFESRIPLDLQDQVIGTIIEDGVYDCPSFRQRSYGAPLVLEATPVTTVIGSTAALAGSSNVAVVSAGLVASAHVGEFIEILSGARIGDRREILDNTTTTITPVRAFSGAIAPGDLFQIIRPTVRLDVLTPIAGTNARVRFCGPPAQVRADIRYIPGLSFCNIQLYSSSAGAQVILQGSVGFFGCDDNGNAQPVGGDSSCGLFGADAHAGNSAVAPWAVGLVSSITKWAGYGYTSRVVNGLEGVAFFGFLVAEAWASSSGWSSPRGGYLRGPSGTPSAPTVVLVERAICSLAGVAGSPSMEIRSLLGTSAFRVYRGARAVLTRCNIVASAGAALRVETGAVVTIDSASGVTGSGTTYGAYAIFGGKIYCENAPIVTGTVANLAAGNTPNTAAALPLAGDVLVAANGDGSLIQRTG